MKLTFEIDVEIEYGEDHDGDHALIVRLGGQQESAKVVTSQDTGREVGYRTYDAFYETKEGFAQYVIAEYVRQINRQVFRLK